MKKLSIYTILLAMALFSIQACGPSEEERQAAEQARLDSLRQVEQQRIEQMMQAREDSLARVEAQKQMEEEKSSAQFSENGTYAIQVGAFRSEAKAQSYKNSISNREYPNVYIIRTGNEETGNIWFRLRVGFFDTKEAASKLGKELGKELNSGYWVSKVERSGS
ncbi:MAG: SPOR domain-containing protein [Balneolaceae bacterium]